MGVAKEISYQRDRSRLRDEPPALSPVLATILGERGRMLRQWWELYASYFDGQRTLSEPEFRDVTGAILDTLESVLRGDTEGFTVQVQQRWRTLATRGVPFAEAMGMVHLFEESALSVLGQSARTNTSIHRLLHQYTYQGLPLMAEVYLQTGIASASERPPIESPTTINVFHGLVGSSAPMRRLYEQIEAVGRSGSTAFVIGETGTGKELVARAIHECGPRPDAPFVAVNCAALPGRLIESELFGHVRGSFTGAEADAPGLFRAANGGTLFLDEITEMSVEAQARLLRALQERTVRPVGSLKEMPVKVRVIASTNRDPREAIDRGLLREDLYYRLNVASIYVPALRERRDDIEALVWHFIGMFNAKLSRGVPIVGVSVQAMEAMRSYAWPGNVRELANATNSALTFGKSETIRLDDLPEAISGAPIEPPAKVMSIPEAERQLIVRSLEASNGNVSAAARSLGISRKKFYARLLRYGMAH